MTNERKVQGTLVGVNGNAFSLMGHFKNLACRQGFNKEWIDSVLEDAMSDDYDHLLYTISSHMTMDDSKDPNSDEYDGEYDVDEEDWDNEDNEYGDEDDNEWVDDIPEDEQGLWRDEDSEESDDEV